MYKPQETSNLMMLGMFHCKIYAVTGERDHFFGEVPSIHA